MKKQLFLLPLMASLLPGCSLFGGKVTLPENTLEEFQGYKVVTKVKEGKRYLLGDYRHREDLMRFASGDYHRDTKGYYPFYMSTVAGKTEGAAEFEIKYLDKSAGEFSIQCFTSDSSLPWNNKYIGVYAAESTYGNQVMSLALLDSPTQSNYTDPKSGNSYKASGTFKFIETYEGLNAYAPAAPFAYPGVDPEPVPKFLGSSMITQEDFDKGEPDYISMDCKRWEDALDPNKYDLAHFYEKA